MPDFQNDRVAWMGRLSVSLIVLAFALVYLAWRDGQRLGFYDGWAYAKVLLAALLAAMGLAWLKHRKALQARYGSSEPSSGNMPP